MRRCYLCLLAAAMLIPAVLAVSSIAQERPKPLGTPPVIVPVTTPDTTPVITPGTPDVSFPKVIEARRGRDVAGSDDLIGFSHVDDAGTQVISLVHTRKLWIAVYHIDSDGIIRLVSSRPIDADFSLQLNTTEPSPDNIRRMSPTPSDPSLSR